MSAITKEAQLQIEKELTASLLKLSDGIGSCDTPSVGFDKSINHFKEEFRRLKTEQYHRIEKDKEAQFILMNEYDKKLAEKDRNIDLLQNAISELKK